MPGKSFRFYEFGPFRVNATERLLQSGAETIPLAPKVMNTLLVLLENSGHVLTKSELIELVWPDSFVAESSLTQNISQLRRVLGECETGRPYIETIPKRGYRFVAEIKEYEHSDTASPATERAAPELPIEADERQQRPLVAEPESSTRDRIATRGRGKVGRTTVVAVALILVSASVVYFLTRHRDNAGTVVPRRVAVLPFKIIGEPNDAEQLSLGMADALIIKLSKIEKPVVLPTSSVARYVSGDRDAFSIGKELGVDGVITGTLQHDGDRVRVSSQLVRLSDGQTIWSAKFDESFSGNFALQDSISSRVAEALAAQVAKDYRQPPTTGTENSQAYQAYATGVHFWNRRTKDDLAKAIVQLEDAVHKDTSFALAHAILADCYYLVADANYDIMPRRDAFIRAGSEADKAISLDDTIAEAHIVKGGLLLMYADMVGADQEFRHALELKPSSATGHLRYAYFLFDNENLKGAVWQMERAQELEPASPVTNTGLGYLLAMARNDDRAISYYRRAVELQPDLAFARFSLVDILARKHRLKEALAELDQLKDTPPRDLLTERAYVYAADGRRNEAAQLLAQVQKADRAKMRPYEWVILYAALGDKKTAFQWLEKINMVQSNTSRLRFDPQLDPLREDKRFSGFLARNQIGPTAQIQH